MVDPFTKWVEIAVLLELNRFESAKSFYELIVCRYGLPIKVRSDHGTEYHSEFELYLCLDGIIEALISTMHPRALDL